MTMTRSNSPSREADSAFCGSVSTIGRVLDGQHRRASARLALVVVDDQDAAARRRSAAAASASGSPGADAARSRACAQFVGHHLQAREAAHAGEQRDVVDRLGEEVVGAGLQALDAVGRLVERGDHHDRDVRGGADWP